MATRRAPLTEVEEVGQWADTLPDKFLLCREMRHSWRPRTARWNSSDNLYERVIQCARCHTERHSLLSVSGHVLSSHYVYPEGYQHTGFGRITGDGLDRLRLASLLRTVEDGAGVTPMKRKRRAS